MAHSPSQWNEGSDPYLMFRRFVDYDHPVKNSRTIFFWFWWWFWGWPTSILCVARGPSSTSWVRYIVEVLDGVMYLHEHKIIHRYL